MEEVGLRCAQLSSGPRCKVCGDTIGNDAAWHRKCPVVGLISTHLWQRLAAVPASGCCYRTENITFTEDAQAAAYIASLQGSQRPTLQYSGQDGPHWRCVTESGSVWGLIVTMHGIAHDNGKAPLTLDALDRLSESLN